MQDKIKGIIQSSIQSKSLVLGNATLINSIELLTQTITEAFRNGNKVLLCGNGGSAADAQHIAAEFTGRFYSDRNPLPSEALHCNTSYITAVANDYGYDHVYSRAVHAMGKKGDVLIALSTSGNSVNIIRAIEKATEGGGKMKNLCDHLINVPSTDTPRIQEIHIMVGHIICQLVEESLF